MTQTDRASHTRFNSFKGVGMNHRPEFRDCRRERKKWEVGNK